MKEAQPRASYRVQLRGSLDLRSARRLAPYLERLGVSHLYLSPVLEARAGSTHGYDGVDPSRVDPALGGEASLVSLSRALKARGLSILLDIVPNHMAAHTANPLFRDVLARGPDSPYATWFDIDWNDRPRARLGWPLLGEPLARCLEHGDLRLEGSGRSLCVRYHDQRLPLASHARPAAAERALFEASLSGRRRLTRLLDAQHYRLAYWRRAKEVLNYRRFFDVNELIALRANQPAAFEACHALPLDWVRRGLLQGLRVDHVDGIDDPRAYLQRLRRELDAAGRSRARPLLWVEKILAHDEALPRGWPVDGTTGYEFAAGVEALFLDADGSAQIAAAWSRWTGLPDDFASTARAGRRHVLARLLAPDLRRLADSWAAHPAAQRARVSPQSLRAALIEVIVHWPVYRTYPDGRPLSAADRHRTRQALEAAARGRDVSRPALAALRAVLLPAGGRAAGHTLALSQRFQQLAAPAAAKGEEDTALYVHTPLLSRNEVGSHPGARLQDAARELHAANAARARHWPRSLLTVSTHDSKRSADVRARLDVLSEIPERWLAAAQRWRRANAPLRRQVGGTRLIDAATEYYLYQTLVGIWPLEALGRERREAELARLVPRLQEHMQKASREARRRTRWTHPNERFEGALRAFVERALAGAERGPFLDEVAQLVAEIARPGLWNALARTLVQLGAPGVPDVYQGDEVWSFSLVDPDNRRPVDFAQLRRRLAQVERGFEGNRARRSRFVRGLLARPEDGKLKLHSLRVGLAARRRHSELFLSGAYHPLAARGAHARHVFAFLRERGPRVALVLVPRLTRTLCAPDAAPIGLDAWRDTRLALPGRFAGRSFRSVLTGAAFRVPRERRPELPVSALLAELPGALLLG